MDITTSNFSAYLPEILNDISCSSFIAIDLEFTGLPSLPGQSGKVQTLQQRYADNKVAAEKYQILQVGLAICRENLIDGSYIMKVYNVHLSPFIERSLDVPRDWSSMSWAMEFLLSNNFSIDTACKDGVRYLSRDEEALSIRMAEQKHSTGKVQTTTDAKPYDEKTLAFFKAVRRQINGWLAHLGDEKAEDQYLNIPAPSHAHRAENFPTTLTSFQKRLVHGLVRAEYPMLTSKSKARGFVQIEQRDSERDKNKQEAQLNSAKARIWKNVGFRWIIEALVGGDLTGLEEKGFQYLLAHPDQTTFTAKELVDRVKLRLKTNRPVLVGHNCFLDLMFLYKCFIGPLPDTVVEFQGLIHGLFPMVVDTKYLATLETQTSRMNSSSLEEVNRGLARARVPFIEIESAHSKYFYGKKCHEAGYDSFLAAVAFLRLSAQLATGKLLLCPFARLDEMRISLAKEISLVNQVAQRMQEDTICVEDSSSNESGDLIELNDKDDKDIVKTYCRPGPFADTVDAGVTAQTAQGRLIPRIGSDFWRLYGNTLRVYGTKEEKVKLGDM